jgi:hypothetical protein
MKTYRITLLGLPIDTSVCPPDIVSAIFPAFDGWTVTMSSEEILVTAPPPPTPADRGPRGKGERVTSPSN